MFSVALFCFCAQTVGGTETSLRSWLPTRQIFLLLFAQGIDLDAHSGQVESRNFVAADYLAVEEDVISLYHNPVYNGNNGCQSDLG